MSFGTIATRGVASNAVTGTSLAATLTATVAVGRILLVMVATHNYDASDGNTNNHQSMSDSVGNVYQKLMERTNNVSGAGTGVTISVWFTRILTQLTTSHSVTVNFANSVPQRWMGLLEAPLTNGIDWSVKVDGSIGNGDNSLTAATSGLTSREHLNLYFAAAQGTDTKKTPPTNFTERFDIRVNSASTATCAEVATRVNTSTGESGAATNWTIVSNTAQSVMISLYEVDVSTAVAQVNETDTAQAIVVSKRIPVSQVAETEIAQIITVGPTEQEINVVQITKSDTAQVISIHKRKEITQVTESDLAQTIGKGKSLTQVNENDQSQVIGKTKREAIDQSTETDLAQVIGKTKIVNVETAIETDSAGAIALLAQNILQQVTETDSSQSIGRTKSKTLVPYSSYEIYCDPVGGAIKYLFFLEKYSEESYRLFLGMDYLTPDVRNWKVGESASPSFFVTLPDDGSEYATGIVVETAIGYSAMDVQIFNANSFIVTETDIAQPISVRKYLTLAQATETETAQTITPQKRINVSQVSELDSANPVLRAKLKQIIQVSEIDVANDITQPGRIVQVSETDTALPIGKKKLVQITAVEETDFAVQLNSILKRLNIVQVSETDEAIGISSKESIFVAVETAVEQDKAYPIRLFDPSKIEEGDLGITETFPIGSRTIASDYNVNSNFLKDELEVNYETPYLQE